MIGQFSLLVDWQLRVDPTHGLAAITTVARELAAFAEPDALPAKPTEVAFVCPEPGARKVEPDATKTQSAETGIPLL